MIEVGAERYRQAQPLAGTGGKEFRLQLIPAADCLTRVHNTIAAEARVHQQADASVQQPVGVFRRTVELVDFFCQRQLREQRSDAFGNRFGRIEPGTRSGWD